MAGSTWFAILATRRRAFNFAAAGVCLAMLAYALYAEKFLGLEPCPLCMFQRVGIGLLGSVFLIAAVHHPHSGAGARVYGVLILLAGCVPGYVAGRHVYIQSLPEGSVPACGATLDFMLDTFPLLEVVRKVLTGGGECAKIDWQFLGLSMPAWVLIAAVALVLLGLLANRCGTAS